MTTFEDTMKEQRAIDEKQNKGKDIHEDHLVYPMNEEMRKMMAESYKIVHK